MSGERVVVDRLMLKLICLVFFVSGLFIGALLVLIALVQAGYIQ